MEELHAHSHSPRKTACLSADRDTLFLGTARGGIILFLTFRGQRRSLGVIL